PSAGTQQQLLGNGIWVWTGNCLIRATTLNGMVFLPKNTRSRKPGLAVTVTSLPINSGKSKASTLTTHNPSPSGPMTWVAITLPSHRHHMISHHLYTLKTAKRSIPRPNSVVINGYLIEQRPHSGPRSKKVP